MKKLGCAVVVFAALAFGLWYLFDEFFTTTHSGSAVSGWFEGKDRTLTRDRVIVFVHGVTGDGKTTWLNEAGKDGKPAYWPALMRSDPQYDAYDIYVVSYHSPHLGGAGSIVDLATGLNRNLTEAEILPAIEKGAPRGRKVREIIFLGHSMGNLIIRTALMIESAYDHVQVPLVLSIASPSNGSSIAEFAEKFSRNPQYDAMVGIKANLFLQLLNSFWKNNLPWDVEVACAHETLPMGGKRLVVEEASATAVCTRRGAGQIAALRDDHSSIVKPAGADSRIYEWTTAQIKERRRFSLANAPARWEKKQIVIGGKDFLESNMLAAMMALMINPRFREDCKDADCIAVETWYQIGGRDRAFEELSNGNIDVYPEYTGTLLANFPDLSVEESRNEANHTTEYINQLFLEKKAWRRYEVLLRFGFRNNYQLVIRRKKADELGLSRETGEITISDLANLPQRANLRFKSTPDFFYRQDGLRGLRERYKTADGKLDFGSIDYTQHENKYRELEESRVDVVDGYTTDPELNDGSRTAFVKVRDDRKFFPQYFAIVMANRAFLDRFGKVRDALLKLQNRITEQDMSRLLDAANKQGIRSEDLRLPEHDSRKKLEQLVMTYLVEKGLLPAKN